MTRPQKAHVGCFLLRVSPRVFTGNAFDALLVSAADNLKMTKLLVEALTEPLNDIDRDYDPLLWSVDRLGRSVALAGAPMTLPATLRSRGFTLISICYLAGITYRWIRGCPYAEMKLEQVCLARYLFSRGDAQIIYATCSRTGVPRRLRNFVGSAVGRLASIATGLRRSYASACECCSRVIRHSKR